MKDHFTKRSFFKWVIFPISTFAFFLSFKYNKFIISPPIFGQIFGELKIDKSDNGLYKATVHF